MDGKETREDKEKRAEWIQKGFCFYDAPAVIFISMDRSLNESVPSFLGIGAIMQSVCLAALNYGLSTCIQTEGVHFPEVVRKYTNIPESKQLIINIAIGYPDWDSPINKLVSARERLENIVTWCVDN